MLRVLTSALSTRRKVQKVVGYASIVKALLLAVQKQANSGDGLSTAMLRTTLSFIRLDSSVRGDRRGARGSSRCTLECSR